MTIYNICDVELNQTDKPFTLQPPSVFNVNSHSSYSTQSELEERNEAHQGKKNLTFKWV